MSWLPDYAAFPDSEAKRRLQNVELQFEQQMSRMKKGASDEELKDAHREANQLWYEANFLVGKLTADQAAAKLDRLRWNVNTWLSILAIAIALASLVVSCGS